ncbi:VWA domain-containing protein [Actinokineospora guangxiensis]|uniref:VWA domain-containing protein n=1 Tax=Actinokineospora guangxiensis TaxID=1490288 RepID=A0ABW0ENS3_9PSEU
MSPKMTGGAARRDHPAWVAPMVLGEVLMALHADALDTPAGLAWFVLGAVLVVVGGMRVFPGVITKVLAWMNAHRGRLTAATAAAVVAALAVWIAAPPAVAYGLVLWFGCEHPTELRVLTAPDDVDTYQDVADAFVRDTAGAGGCPTVHVHVYGVEPATALDAIGVGWQDEQLERHGGRPDVLITGSRVEVDALSADLDGAPGSYPVVGDTRTVAWSPLVLGVPIALADQLHEDRRIMATWHDLLREVRALGIGVARPYPTGSGVGLLAADALLSTAPSGGLVSMDQARGILSWTSTSTKAAGLPLDSAVAMLAAHRASPEAATAVIVPEQALARSNLLASTADGVRRPCIGASAAPNCLLAFYPNDTYRVWHSATPLRWSPGSRAHGAALAFTGWLGGEAGQAALWETGLRTNGQTGSDLLNQRNGMFAGPRTATMRDEPDTKRRAAVVARQLPGRVLIALDASASMRDMATPRSTRMDVATEGVRGAIDRLGENDTVGLWTFSGRGVAEVVPFSPRDGARRLVGERLREVPTGGGTPLYRAVREGVDAVDVSDGARVGALVVLTDGEDTFGDKAADMLAATRDRGVRVFVLAIGETTCGDRVIADLTEQTHGGCATASPASVDNAITALFQQLWG